MAKVKTKPKVQAVSLEQLIKADWNYKTDGTQEEIEKLAKSIDHDKSAGVLAVREVETDEGPMLEVMDGNHRLDAIKHLGWPKVVVENFGPITKAQAVTVARRRNHSWFDDDLFKLGKLYNEEVLKEFSIDELKEFMPESELELEGLINMGNFDWEPPELKIRDEKDEDDLSDSEQSENESSHESRDPDPGVRESKRDGSSLVTIAFTKEEIGLIEEHMDIHDIGDPVQMFVKKIIMGFVNDDI